MQEVHLLLPGWNFQPRHSAQLEHRKQEGVTTKPYWAWAQWVQWTASESRWSSPRPAGRRHPRAGAHCASGGGHICMGAFHWEDLLLYVAPRSLHSGYPNGQQRGQVVVLRLWLHSGDVSKLGRVLRRGRQALLSVLVLWE
jgi:hypothetical protein